MFTEEALQEAENAYVLETKTTKTRPDYSVLTIGYTNVLVAYEKGLEIMKLLAGAEEVSSDYQSSKKPIEPFNSDALTFKTMSEAEYKERKLSGFLGLCYSDYLKHKREAEEHKKAQLHHGE